MTDSHLEARGVLVGPVEGRVLLLCWDALNGRHHRGTGVLGARGNGTFDGGNVSRWHPTVPDEDALGVPQRELVEDVVDSLHLPNLNKIQTHESVQRA